MSTFAVFPKSKHRVRFQDLIGLHEQAHGLAESVRLNRSAHARLFEGPQGGGGLALAWAYAGLLLCTAPPEAREHDRCGVCNACQKTTRLTHPDLHFSFPSIAKGTGPAIAEDSGLQWRQFLMERPYRTYSEWMEALGAENKQGNISVAECHAIIHNLTLTAVEDGPKVLILWLPEYLREAGNTLLKIMEEPPEGTYFLLVTERPDDILITIRSRTQPLRIPPLKEEEIAAYLEKSFNAEPNLAHIAARLSGGNVPLAISLLDSQPDRHFESFTNWMRICYTGKMLPILKFTETQATEGREGLKQFLGYGLHLLRQCLMYSLGQDALARDRPSETEFAKRFAPFVHSGNIFQLAKAFEEASYHIERNANPRLVLIRLSLDMSEWIRWPNPRLVETDAV